MPKATFFNLPDAKQEAIRDAAFREFAQHPLETASLSRVVHALGIAKGSMYQYFTDKRDLYRYVVEEAYRVKNRYLEPVWAAEYSFFSRIKAYYQATYVFSREQPLFHRIIHHFWDSKDAALREDIQTNLARREEDFRNMVELGRAAGEISNDVSNKAAFFVYHSVGKQLIEDFQNLGPEDQEVHRRFIEEVFDILEVGFRSSDKERGAPRG